MNVESSGHFRYQVKISKLDCSSVKLPERNLPQ